MICRSRYFTLLHVCFDRSQSTAARKRRSLDQNVPTPEVVEKKQVWYNSDARKMAPEVCLAVGVLVNARQNLCRR